MRDGLIRLWENMKAARELPLDGPVKSPVTADATGVEIDPCRVDGGCDMFDRCAAEELCCLAWRRYAGLKQVELQLRGTRMEPLTGYLERCVKAEREATKYFC